MLLGSNCSSLTSRPEPSNLIRRVPALLQHEELQALGMWHPEAFQLDAAPALDGIIGWAWHWGAAPGVLLLLLAVLGSKSAIQSHWHRWRSRHAHKNTKK